KSEDLSSYDPWTTSNTKSKTTPKSAVTKRIEAVHKEHSSSPLSPNKQPPVNRQIRSKMKLVESPAANIASSIINKHIDGTSNNAI
ncbi:11184_t:CDS:1, partial [Paraglomus brasilianum]